MNLHLGTNKDGWKFYLGQIKNFVGEELQKCEDYRLFFSIEVNTKFDSSVCAIFTEQAYGKGDYGIMLFKRANHEEQIFIPVKYVDTIFGL